MKTFVELVLLRKGPEDIPRSSLLLAVAVAMAIISTLLVHAIVETDYVSDIFLEFATELVKIAAYVVVLSVAGFIRRVTQTMTAIVACTAIMALVFVVIFAFSRPFVGYQVALAIAWFVTPWLILVEGHIISRAIQQHWFTGIVIAIVIFVLQLGFYLTFSDIPEGTGG